MRILMMKELVDKAYNLCGDIILYFESDMLLSENYPPQIHNLYKILFDLKSKLNEKN